MYATHMLKQIIIGGIVGGITLFAWGFISWTVLTWHFDTIKQDEVWHFYDGTALTLHFFDPKGRYSTVTLGKKIQNGEVLMAVIKAGWVFGATVEPTSYALVGCTVAPGFDFTDLNIPKRSVLLKRFPQYPEIIKRLTRTAESDK